jgi:hypothetical protein
VQLLERRPVWRWSRRSASSPDHDHRHRHFSARRVRVRASFASHGRTTSRSGSPRRRRIAGEVVAAHAAVASLRRSRGSGHAPYGLATMARLAPRNARIPGRSCPVALIVAAAAGLPGEMRAQPRFIAVPEALRELGVRHSPNATVYLSSDIGPACTYYLAWHPDRATLGGDSSSRDCTLRGTRTVIGQWPRFVGLAPGRATRREDDPSGMAGMKAAEFGLTELGCSSATTELRAAHCRVARNSGSHASCRARTRRSDRDVPCNGQE